MSKQKKLNYLFVFEGFIEIEAPDEDRARDALASLHSGDKLEHIEDFFEVKIVSDRRADPSITLIDWQEVDHE